uniref:RNA-directed DNA polymerase n=1 Tax=Moniliophthora roreri TaxID=221103 RepID=A0A0W0GCQ7_MONRR
MPKKDERKQEEPKKLTKEERFAKIRALVNEQPKEDKDFLLDMMEQEANKTAWITHVVELEFQIAGKEFWENFMISGIGDEEMILGLPWLWHYNPAINWETREIQFQPRRKIQIKRFKGVLDSFEPEVLIGAKTTASQEMAHQHQTVKKEIEELIPNYLLGYRDRFEKGKAERFPPARTYNHAIDLKPDFVPRNCKLYPLSPIEQEEQDKFIEENLRKGYIRKSKSPMASPFFFVDKLKGATVFTKLDLRNGYNNVRIKDGDQWKAAFKMNRWLFEPTVMFFGLSNSPATFQAFMNDILSDFIDEGWCVVYMDDILIFSKDQNEHRERTERLMRRLQEHDLFLKLEKCEFDVTEVVFLGMVIRPGYIAMDPVKLAGIADWEPPQTVKGEIHWKIRAPNEAIERPITEKLKVRLDNAMPIMPDINKPFVIEADTSKWATGAVLRQKGADGEWHPCGYLSKSFSATERNYEIYDRELLAIYRALMEWRHYLMGGKFRIVVLPDHKNLTYFRTAQKLNRRQARWSLFLSEFDLGLVHVPGKSISQADALLRWRNDLGMKEDIAERLGPDDFHKSALEQLLHQGVPPIKSALADWKIEGDLLFFQGRVYVPNDIELRRRIVWSIHETPGVGHPGQWNTVEQVQWDFWWPGMAKFIKAFMDGCVVCQQSKIITHPTRTPIQPIQVAPNSFTFQICTMDLITDLPECDGMDSILVVVDHSSTKGVIFTPCTKTMDTTKVAEMLIQHLYKRFGLPDRIISDQDPRFAAEVFQEMGKQLSIKHSMSTAFHPQTDRETERVNREIEVYLRAFCAKEQTQWKEYLPLAEFAHNNRTHLVLKTSPFFMMMGYHPRLLPTVFERTTIPSVEERLQELKRIREETASLLELARQQMIRREKQKLDVFEEGQKVWLEAKNLAMGYPSKKLALKREGPFKVLKVLRPVTYKLDLPHQWKIHPVFHAALLSPFKQMEAHGPSFTEPPPDLIEEFEEYEVEAVVGHRPKKQPREFLVSYTGYNSSHNRWIQMEGMANSMSNASSAASSSSLAGSQPTRDQSPVPTVSGEGRYGENITYSNGLKLNPYQLLHLFNTRQYNDQIRNAADQHNQLEPCVKSLFFLRGQQKLFERIVESCSLEIANQVMYACNYQLGLEGPVTIPERCRNTLIPSPSVSLTDSEDTPTGMDTPVLTSTTLGASSPGSPPSQQSKKPNSPPLPIPPLNPTTPSFILTPLLILMSNLRSSRSTPLPPLSPNLRPPPTSEIFRRLKPQFHQTVEHIPTVGGEVVPVELEGAAEDEERENRIPKSADDPPILSLRSPTPAPTPMMQLVDRISALCADWSAILPNIARSTCVVDASRLNLDIRLATALTNEGLAVLRADGLIQAQTLCRMVAIMTMNGGTMTNPTTTSAESVEMLTEEYDRDAQLLFVGADPKKVRLLSVEERQAMGWQPTSDPPATPLMEVEDEMPDLDDRPDTSYDYDTELYGDRES